MGDTRRGPWKSQTQRVMECHRLLGPCTSPSSTPFQSRQACNKLAASDQQSTQLLRCSLWKGHSQCVFGTQMWMNSMSRWLQPWWSRNLAKGRCAASIRSRLRQSVVLFGYEVMKSCASGHHATNIVDVGEAQI